MNDSDQPVEPIAGAPAAGAPEQAVPEVPAAAAALFGTATDDVARYVAMLAGDGVVRGLIGPREVPLLWDRLVYNC